MSREREIDEEIERRKFIKYGGAAGLSGVMAGGVPGVLADGDEYADVDDEGNPIDEDEFDAEITTASQEVNPSSTPDGTIGASQYEWISGAPDGEGGTGLRLTDDGGVDPNFRLSTNDDLTIDFYWRHHSGGSLAYMFNDQDSTGSGFRAFTNGVAGNGLLFRNDFGGSDISVSGNFQDGDWYHIRVVLDASQNTFTVYVDGSQAGQSYYNGNGFTARDQFRVMGRRSGSSTRVDYDRFVIAPEAIHPGEGPVTSDLIHYPLISGEGTTVVNEPSGNPIEEKAELIDTIRSEAGVILPEILTDELDENAEALLAEIEETFDGGKQTLQHEEALNRMITAEGVTESAVVTGRDPARKTAEATTDLLLMLGFIGFAKGALATRGGRVGDILSSKLDDMASKARRGVRWLVGILPKSWQKQFEGMVDRANRRIEEFIEDHGDQMESAGEEITSGTLAEVFDFLSDSVIDALTTIREAIVRSFTFLLYFNYLTQTEEIDEDGERTRDPGIDTTINEAMDDLSGSIDEERLRPDGEQAREEKRREEEEWFEDARETFLDGMDVMDDVIDGLSLLTLAIAGGALVLYGAALLGTALGGPLGLGLGGFAAKLTTVAVGLGAFTVALTGGQVLLGRGFLVSRMTDHEEAIDFIVNYEAHGGDH